MLSRMISIQERVSMINRIAIAGLCLLAVLGAFNYAAETQPTVDRQPSEVTALRNEVERLKTLVPDQSHAMSDVGDHFANLWFAGQKQNWPLADFFWSETRSHLRWAVRIIPVRKDPQGNEIRLTEILEPIEKTALAEIGNAIKARDQQQFTTTYKQMLDSCYACHLASGKPFLRLRVPDEP